MLRPRRPGTGPARPLEGTQRRTVRVHGLTFRHVRPGELRVLQEDEGTREGGGAPQGWVNGDGALAALVERGEHVFGSLRWCPDGTRVRASHLAESAEFARPAWSWKWGWVG